MGGIRALWLLPALGLAGCYGPSPQAQASLAAVQRDNLELDRALDELEARLLADQALVRHWGELAMRHREVSALACGNAVAHTAQEVALRERKRFKGRSSRVATREGGLGGPAP